MNALRLQNLYMDPQPQAPRPAGALSRPEVMMVVSYIGVAGGYLGDFTYPSHAEFYPRYCELDIDPEQYEGTTRQRFIKILSSLGPRDQAKVLRGVLVRFPRSTDAQTALHRLIDRLESRPVIPAVASRVTSDAVTRALADAETLLRASGATSAVDRVHTAFHGYLRAVCDDAGLTYERDASMTTLFKLLRQGHPKLSPSGPRVQDIQKIVNSMANVIDALNPIRNRATGAHPNDALGEAEALWSSTPAAPCTAIWTRSSPEACKPPLPAGRCA